MYLLVSARARASVGVGVLVRARVCVCVCAHVLSRCCSYAILTTKLSKRGAILVVGSVIMILYIRKFMERMAHAEIDV